MYLIKFQSIILILLDLFVVRLFLYFPQLCSKFSTIFINYPIISDIYFPIYNYARVFKTGSQCGMILSRLFCVLIPFGHDEVVISSEQTLLNETLNIF